MLILGLVKLSQVSKYDWLGKNAQNDVLGYAIQYLRSSEEGDSAVAHAHKEKLRKYEGGVQRRSHLLPPPGC